MLTDLVLENKIVEAISTCYDPEIPVNIYELGLIYGVEISEDKDVVVLMTLTSPACPVAGTLPPEVEERVRGVEGGQERRGAHRLGAPVGSEPHVRGCPPRAWHGLVGGEPSCFPVMRAGCRNGSSPSSPGVLGVAGLPAQAVLDLADLWLGLLERSGLAGEDELVHVGVLAGGAGNEGDAGGDGASAPQFSRELEAVGCQASHGDLGQGTELHAG